VRDQRKRRHRSAVVGRFSRSSGHLSVRFAATALNVEVKKWFPKKYLSDSPAIASD
jgi:hypothetical protein